MPQLKLGNIRVTFPNFQNCASWEKYYFQGENKYNTGVHVACISNENNCALIANNIVGFLADEVQSCLDETCYHLYIICYIVHYKHCKF